jgi:hypothetical protein
LLVDIKLGLMNPSDADIVELNAEFRPYRDELRIAGYELVRYALSHARQEASRYRHPTADYEYGIHKIEFIDPKSLQIYINRHPFYSSASRVPDWTKYHVDKERPAGAKLLTGWFTDPVRAIITVFVPPYGLTLLGLAAIADRLAAGQQKERQGQLRQLSERPKFMQPYSGT